MNRCSRTKDNPQYVSLSLTHISTTLEGIIGLAAFKHLKFSQKIFVTATTVCSHAERSVMALGGACRHRVYLLALRMDAQGFKVPAK